MEMKFTLQESFALYGLLADNTTDIILKTDREGFILHASPAIERLGLVLPDMLIPPHILDLVHPSYASAVRAEHEAAVEGRQRGKWIEFPAIMADDREGWFAIQTRSLADAHGHIYGALSIMRSIQEKRALEDKLFAAALTDPLTGLTNRKAFVAMLRHLLDKQIGGCLAMFKIDHFKAMNIQHGQSFGDQVLIAFSDLLLTLLRQEDIVSRVGGESLGVLLPATTPEKAEGICRHILSTLSEVSKAAGGEGFHLTASAGLAPIGKSLDDTIKRAELALFLAKARGISQLERDTGPAHPRALGRYAG